MARLARLLVLGALSGGLAGLAAFAFTESLTWATRQRVETSWLVWLLPIAGLAIGVTYHHLGGRATRGTRLAVHEARSLAGGVPARMAPLIFASAVVGHLFGASVGREGAAVQMSASLTDSGARLLRLADDDRQVLLGASLAGGFAAILGAPFAGLAFSTELTRRRRVRPVLACMVAAGVGEGTVAWLGHAPTIYPNLSAPAWTAALVCKLLIAGALFGAIGRLYMWSGDQLGHRLITAIGWPPLRPVVGGLATIGLVALFGRDYLGLSLPLLDQATGGMHLEWWTPLLKLLFTVIAIGSGFVGGEVIPLFVIGSTFGSVIAAPLHVSPLLLGACGLAVVFTAAAQIGITGVVIATELFGWNATIPAMIVAAAAHLSVGSQGLYVNRNETAVPHGA